MASFGIFCASVLVTILSTTQAIEFFQTVEGNCTDIPVEKEYNSTKAASGEWYFHYGSFGKEGDKCASGHAVQRGNQNFVDLLLYDADINDFVNMANDLTTDPEQPGLYFNDQGAVGFILAADPELKKYFYYLQCVETVNQTLASIIVASRVRSTNPEPKKVYKEVSKKLEEIKLLPKPHKIIQTDCDGL